MKIISSIASKLYGTKIGRAVAYTAFVFVIGYGAGKGVFSEKPKYQRIDPAIPVQCAGEIYHLNPKQGKLEKITEYETRKEGEEILKKRNR